MKMILNDTYSFKTSRNTDFALNDAESLYTTAVRYLTERKSLLDFGSFGPEFGRMKLHS